MFRLNFINKIFVIMIVCVCNTICWADPQIWSSNSKSNAGNAGTYQIDTSGALTRTSDETRLVAYSDTNCNSEIDDFPVNGSATFDAGATKIADGSSIYTILTQHFITPGNVLSMWIIPMQNGVNIFTGGNACFIMMCNGGVEQCDTSSNPFIVSLSQPGS